MAYKTNTAKKIETSDPLETYTREMRAFEKNYKEGNFDEAMKNALTLDGMLYEAGIDLLEL